MNEYKQLDLFKAIHKHIETTYRYTQDKPGMDVWTPIFASPMSTYFAGDCEDLSNAKKLHCQLAGIPAENLVLVAGELKRTGEAHCVLQLNLSTGSSIACNTQRSTRSTESYYKRFTPIYELKQDALYVYGQRVPKHTLTKYAVYAAKVELHLQAMIAAL